MTTSPLAYHAPPLPRVKLFARPGPEYNTPLAQAQSAGIPLVDSSGAVHYLRAHTDGTLETYIIQNGSTITQKQVSPVLLGAGLNTSIPTTNLLPTSKVNTAMGLGVATYTAGTNPDIGSNHFIEIANTGATTIRAITSSFYQNRQIANEEGQLAILWFADANTTVGHGAGGNGQILLAGGANITFSAHGTLILVGRAVAWNNYAWYELAHAVGNS